MGRGHRERGTHVVEPGVRDDANPFRGLVLLAGAGFDELRGLLFLGHNRNQLVERGVRGVGAVFVGEYPRVVSLVH